jgi:predicted MFS family arabinose efflux permease
VGGLLIAAGGWQWIFLINVPLGLVGLASLRRVSVGAGADRSSQVDPGGLVLLAGGLTLALFGASRAPVEGWTDPLALAALGSGAGLLGAYAGWSGRRPHPAVDLILLRHRQSALALGLSVLSSVVAFGAIFLLPVFTQSVQGHSALATGVALLPQGLITGLGTALGQRLAVRVTVRALVVAGFVGLALTSAALLLLSATTPLWATAGLLCGRAIAIGFGITPLLFAMLEPLTDAQLPDANTVFSIAQRLGGSLGVGLLASLFAARTAATGAVAAFHQIAVVLTAVAVLAAALSLKLAPVRAR